MMFKGERWQKSKSAVTLPETVNSHWMFGRACKKSAKGAVKTDWVWGQVPERLWEDDGNGKKLPEPDRIDEQDGPVYYVYAKPIPCDGHSLTNLMYGKDGMKYLLYEEKVYVRAWQRR